MEEVSRSYSLSANEINLVGVRVAEFFGNKNFTRFMNEALSVAKAQGDVKLDDKLVDTMIKLADESLLGASGAITIPAEITLHKMKGIRSAL